MRFFTFFLKISKTGYLVALIALLTRIGFFMSLPFLAVYLTKDGIFTPGEIGMILGISGFVFSISGLFNGLYIDRHSQRNVLIASLILSAFAYFSMAISIKLFFGLLCANAMLGWLRSLADISSVSILVAATDKENLPYAYSARFIAINLGLVFGPLFGAVMAQKESLIIFYVSGIIHLIVGISLLVLDKNKLDAKTEFVPMKLFENFRELWKDKVLINITLINFLIWVAYSQMESSIPQYITQTVENPAILVGKLLLVNAIFCVLFQPIIMRWAENTSFKISGMVGSLLFSGMFLLIAFFPSPTTLIIGAGMLSVGELFTLPINGLLVMRTAPKHLVASYNGLANLGLLGLSVGPIFGGYMLQYFNAKTLFLIIACIPLIVLWRYWTSIPAQGESI